MTSSLSISNPAGTAVPGLMVNQRPVESLCAVEQEPVGLTESELQEWHLRYVEGLRAARCVEQAMEAGNKPQARVYLDAMESATRACIALRTIGLERLGACHFDVAGQVHREAGGAACGR